MLLKADDIMSHKYVYTPKVMVSCTDKLTLLATVLWIGK